MAFNTAQAQTEVINITEVTEQVVNNTPAIDSGDTAWILVSTALVLFMMLPGLALFYAGLVHKKRTFNPDEYLCHHRYWINFGLVDCTAWHSLVVVY